MQPGPRVILIQTMNDLAVGRKCPEEAFAWEGRDKHLLAVYGPPNPAALGPVDDTEYILLNPEPLTLPYASGGQFVEVKIYSWNEMTGPLRSEDITVWSNSTSATDGNTIVEGVHTYDTREKSHPCSVR
ncbi:unnamed protein product [Cylindrotheca closterium]|uniref:Uncharacterized protein n=1 Tax=Cylindrotheca closterium TaxID=2856 RepID=A0AAD2CXN9_9STRA|nr:unnamed protein product [Cylindrotheca closterium]